MGTITFEHIAGWMEFVVILIILLVVMWVERKTPEEDTTSGKKGAAPRYNIYIGEKHYLGTDNKEIAIDAFNEYCRHTEKQIRLFEGGTIIMERKEV